MFLNFPQAKESVIEAKIEIPIWQRTYFAWSRAAECNYNTH